MKFSLMIVGLFSMSVLSQIMAQENPKNEQLMTTIEQSETEKQNIQQQVSLLADQIQQLQTEAAKYKIEMQTKFEKQLHQIEETISSNKEEFNIFEKTISQETQSLTTELQQKKQETYYNSSGRPQVKKGKNLFISADWLIWQAAEQNVDAFEANGFGTEIPNPIDAQEGHLKSPQFRWASGARVGLGYNMGHDQWDLSLTWTWFQDRASKSAAGTLEIPIVGVISGPSFGIESLSASSHLRLLLNQLDMDLGKEFRVSKWFTLKPFAGIQSSWTTQSWTTKFVGHVSTIYTESGDPEFINEFDVYLKQKFWGIGPRAGLGAEFGLYDGLSIFSNMSLNLLYGQFRTERTERSVSLDGVPTINSQSIRHERSGQPIADVQLGLRWDYGFSQDRFLIRLQAGWENHLFFDHNLFYTQTSRTASIINSGGNLDFQGWFISARFDF
ncbi:MAG: hypothetical protein RLZZ453_839 [Chlamydiota bacterium]|jgi:hypothetical protein